jgi:hypothetical protein
MPIPEFRDDGWLPIGHHKAEWEEIAVRFGGEKGTRRADLTAKLLQLRQSLQAAGVSGTILLDGSFISEKREPGDFDVLIVGPADLQVMKDTEPNLASLLDASTAEAQGYSLFFVTEDSPMRQIISTVWDFSKEGIAKGIVELAL